MTGAEILIVDDEESIRLVLKHGLEKRGYRVRTASDGESALEEALRRPYALVFMDIKMPGMSGLEVLEKLKEKRPQAMVVIITAQGSMANAISAMKKGAYDYIVKPFDLEQIYLMVERCLRERAVQRKLTAYATGAAAEHQDDEIIGVSPAMQEVFLNIGKVAGSDATVLILGESGTGKEMVARTIHHNSPRSDNPFIAVNCAAVPRDLLESEFFGHEKGAFTGATTSKMGKFELAEGGTIFLDEVGELDLAMQSKVLRVLQEKEIDRVGGSYPIKVDVRVIAATDRDLAQAMKEKQFRDGLYYRLNVVQIKLPSLRERKDDIPLLTRHFLAKFQEELGTGPKYLSSDAAKLLMEYSWPGNVRELENMLKRSMILSTGESITPEHFPSFLREEEQPQGEARLSIDGLLEEKLRDFVHKMCRGGQEGLYYMVMERLEKPLLEMVLAECKGNQLKAARVLGINRNTLRKKLQALDIEVRKE
jgi:two-component system nitrogen regulation response regulator GlnG